MKKTIIVLMSLTGVAIGDSTTPNWTVIDNKNGTLTYTATIYGEYEINLGKASIKNGESFTLSVLQTSTVWMTGTDWGCGIVGTTNPLSQAGSRNNNQNDNFSVYLGAQKNDTQVRWSINNWTYANEKCPSENKDKVFIADYTNVPSSVDSTTPLTLGIVLTYDATTDNRSLTMAAHKQSQLQFNSHTESKNFITTYNFSTLTNINKEHNKTYGQPANTVTVISITKAGSLVPEPTTATLSLLALAGLAARRRRR